jgi:hypothetical protein
MSWPLAFLPVWVSVRVSGLLALRDELAVLGLEAEGGAGVVLGFRFGHLRAF